MRFRTLTATAVALLTLGSAAATFAGPASATTATPTVTATPYYALSTTTTTSVDVAISNFEAATPVYAVECSLKVETASASDQANDCDVATLATSETDATGAVDIPEFTVQSAGYSDNNKNKCDQADPCAIVVTDSLTSPVDKAATPLYFGPYVSATPSTNLKNKQAVTLTVAGFTDSASSSVLAVECSKAALKYASQITKAIAYCDTNSPASVTLDKSGAGTAKFTIVAGAGYSDTGKDKCDGANPCYIAVGSLASSQFGYTPISFASSVVTPVATTTKVTGPKKGKAGKKVKISAKTTAKAKNGTLSGKVVFTDNGKKVASVKETSSGTVHAKVKLRKGKNKIVATYSGNSSYVKSSGKLTITAKKAHHKK